MLSAGCFYVNVLFLFSNFITKEKIQQKKIIKKIAQKLKKSSVPLYFYGLLKSANILL